MKTPDQELDTRGLNCPLPLLKTKKTIGQMESGKVLKILATDPGLAQDIDGFIKQTGHQLLDVSETGDEFHFLLQKA